MSLPIDWGVISGLMSALLIVLFLVLFVWAWSRRQRQRFDQAAQLALDPEDRTVSLEEMERRP